MGIWSPGPGATASNDTFAGDASDEQAFGLDGDDVLNGFGGNDVLFGDAGNDTLNGDDGSDLLSGGAGADQMSGGLGDDIYIVESALDVVVESPGSGDDLVSCQVTSYVLPDNVERLEFNVADLVAVQGTGNALVNYVRGGSGNDTLDGGAGADTLEGGLGDDTYLVDNAADAIVDLSGTNTVRTTVSYSLVPSNPRNASLVFVGTGNFVGVAAGSTLSVVGGDGDDTLDSRQSVATLIGGAGNDTYLDTAGGNTIVELVGGGIDTLQTANALSTLPHNVENLTYTGVGNGGLNGNALNNTITSGATNDFIDGKSGDDTMVGGAGDDTYVVDSTSDAIVELASEGNDTALVAAGSFVLSANVENLTFVGSTAFAGTGNGLANTITGGAGNDTLNGLAGADLMTGGAGNDTYIVDDAGDVVTEAGGEGIDIVLTTRASYTPPANVENVTYAGAGAFTGGVNAENNVITGGTGNDTLGLGGTLGGTDVLNGAGGDDIFYLLTATTTAQGGVGTDIYILVNGIGTVVENLNEGTFDRVENRKGTSYTLPDNVEELTFNTTNAVTATGNSIDNLISTGAFNDTISGLAGNDGLFGGAGDDFLDGGAGADHLFGDTGIDTATYASSALGVSINLATNSASGGDAAGDAFSSVENLIGSAFNDTLRGSVDANMLVGGAGFDTLEGFGGDDTLDGGVGADTMTGGPGNDTYVVDNAFDAVLENAGEGVDTVRVNLTASIATAAALENIVLTGSAAINATGNAGANTLTGNSGDNILDGGAGNDMLIGGGGNDTFVVDSTSDMVTELVGEGTDTVRTTLASFVLGSTCGSANVENLSYIGAGDFIGVGGANVATMIGAGGADTLIGSQAGGSLDGGAGQRRAVVLRRDDAPGRRGVRLCDPA